MILFQQMSACDHQSAAPSRDLETRWSHMHAKFYADRYTANLQAVERSQLPVCEMNLQLNDSETRRYRLNQKLTKRSRRNRLFLLSYSD
jgi:hypothetical protein